MAASAVTVEISEARRRRLAEGIVVTYTVGVATANEAQTVTSAISSSSTADVDAAISKAATNAGLDDDFDGVTTTNVGTPTTTASGDDDGGNGGADAASAGLIAGVVVGVAALAAIAFGAYWFMRAKGGAAAGAEPPMIEVQEMAPAPVPRKDQLYAAAVPVASAPPIMPPPPPEPAQERPSMLSRLASWRAPAAEAPTGRCLVHCVRRPGPGPVLRGVRLARGLALRAASPSPSTIHRFPPRPVSFVADVGLPRFPAGGPHVKADVAFLNYARRARSPRRRRSRRSASGRRTGRAASCASWPGR